MKLNIRLACLVALSTLAVGVFPTLSNAHPAPRYEAGRVIIIDNNLELSRAKNLARQAAEVANGGLGNYRAEAAMHGPAQESPFVENGNGTWTFIFQGHKPGASVYTVETVVTVSHNGRVRVNYNGPIRHLSQ